MKGKGTLKEYNQLGQLIFEGEYNDGKRYKGKGKEYKDDKLIFEGEYNDGKRYNGKMMQYYGNGNLLFVGKYSNGILNGKQYNENGELIFEGECSHFCGGFGRNGKGKEYKDGKIIFDGEYYHGKRWNGKGKEFNEEGKIIFEGKYKNGEKC